MMDVRRAMSGRLEPRSGRLMTLESSGLGSPEKRDEPSFRTAHRSMRTARWALPAAAGLEHESACGQRGKRQQDANGLKLDILHRVSLGSCLDEAEILSQDATRGSPEREWPSGTGTSGSCCAGAPPGAAREDRGKLLRVLLEVLHDEPLHDLLDG